MAQDRFVTWREGKEPTRREIGRALRRYLGGVGAVRWDARGRRFYATLPGKLRNPFTAERDATYNTERWIEVYVAPGEPFDVITRAQDGFTNALAEGFAAACARRWDGKREL